MNNDSSQQALNCSLNPSPSGRRMTVIMWRKHFCKILNHVLQNHKQTFLLLQSVQEHPPSALHQDLRENLFQPRRCSLHTPLRYLCTICWWHHWLWQQGSGREKIIFTLNGTPNNDLVEKNCSLGCPTCTLLVACTPVYLDKRNSLEFKVFLVVVKSVLL